MISNNADISMSDRYLEKFNSLGLSDDEMREAICYKNFRLGCFYFIMDAQGRKVRFKRNKAQRIRYQNSHQRDIILKARQLGFTTDKMISDLDDCLFNENHHAGCIAHGDKPAKDIYRNKIRYAYRNIEDWVIGSLKELHDFDFPYPLSDKDNSYYFSNGSSIGVSTGFRGGTLQSLHVSEFGKICKKFPDRALEIVTGAFPACSGKNSTITIESTAEGKQGYFYEYCVEAMAALGQKLNPMQFKFHFFPWHFDDKYSIDSDINYEHLAGYFDELAAKHGIKLSDPQKQWYAAQQLILKEKMTQEFPSTPDEAFAQKIKGAYYSDQIAEMYKDGRYVDDYYDNDANVYTAWDIGIGDSTAIWFYQLVGNEVHIINYLECSGKPLGFYIKQLQELARKHGWNYARHHAPHDINNREFASDGRTRKEQARSGVEYQGKIYNVNFTEVAKISIADGIEEARGVFRRCVFFTGLGKSQDDELGLKIGTEFGLNCLESYRKEWDQKLGTWKDNPLHDWSSHGSDAFRYLSVAINRRVTAFKLNRIN